MNPLEHSKDVVRLIPHGDTVACGFVMPYGGVATYYDCSLSDEDESACDCLIVCDGGKGLLTVQSVAPTEQDIHMHIM